MQTIGYWISKLMASMTWRSSLKVTLKDFKRRNAIFFLIDKVTRQKHDTDWSIAEHVCFAWTNALIAFLNEKTLFSPKTIKHRLLTWKFSSKFESGHWSAPRTRNLAKNGPSLRLRTNWWPESVFLVLTTRKADSGDEIASHSEIWTKRVYFLFRPIYKTTTFCLSRQIPFVVRNLAARFIRQELFAFYVKFHL